MSVLHPHHPPATGFRGLRENWHNDVLAAFSVSMVALPLSLGIAVAAEAPAVSGLLAALVAGLVTTFVRGSHIAINGPGNAHIAVILMGMTSLHDGSGHTFQYVLAAIVFAGALQAGIGLLRLGKLGDVFPTSVIHGILAAIGLIILGKQVHVALGSETHAKSTLGILLDIPHSVMQIHPTAALIAGLSLAIFFFYPRVKNKLLHFIPAPMWVLVVAVPLAILFSSSDTKELVWGILPPLTPSFFVNIPADLFGSMMTPNFSRVKEPVFWGVVLSITLISSIETLISVNAVDKLDPYKRRTDANKELIGTGLSSVLAGMIGGFPIVTVIARSSVNVNNFAKTRWSNFFVGVFLLLFLLLFAPVIEMVPLAALAAILVYTGYKLTSPKVFKDAHKRGWEQLLFTLVTLGATLLTNLVWGLVIGTVFTYLFHNIRLGTSPSLFFRTLIKPDLRLEQRGEMIHCEPKGLLSFANILTLRRTLEQLPPQKSIVLGLSQAQMVDFTSLEYLYDFAERYQHDGGTFELLGLDQLQASSSHPHALRVYGLPTLLARKTEHSLSRRQWELKRLAEEQGWTYRREIDWDASYLKNFQFFETRPLEYKENVLAGEYETYGVDWEIADLIFDEGAVLVEEYQTTAQILYLSTELPEFVIEREEFFDRLMELMGYEVIDFHYYNKFSRRFVVKGKSLDEMEDFFTPSLVNFFETHDIYHLESNGEALLVFRNFRLERTKGILDMHQFSRELLEEIHSSLNGHS